MFRLFVILEHSSFSLSTFLLFYLESKNGNNGDERHISNPPSASQNPHKSQRLLGSIYSENRMGGQNSWEF